MSCRVILRVIDMPDNRFNGLCIAGAQRNCFLVQVVQNQYTLFNKLIVGVSSLRFHFFLFTIRHGVEYRSRGEKSKATPMEVQARVNTKVTENIRELPPVLLMEED